MIYLLDDPMNTFVIHNPLLMMTIKEDCQQYA
jgi:hypothetical protein